MRSGTRINVDHWVSLVIIWGFVDRVTGCADTVLLLVSYLMLVSHISLRCAPSGGNELYALWGLLRGRHTHLLVSYPAGFPPRSRGTRGYHAWI